MRCPGGWRTWARRRGTRSGHRRQSRLIARPVFDVVHDVLAAGVVLLSPGNRGVREANVAVLAVICENRERVSGGRHIVAGGGRSAQRGMVLALDQLPAPQHGAHASDPRRFALFGGCITRGAENTRSIAAPHSSLRTTSTPPCTARPHPHSASAVPHQPITPHPHASPRRPNPPPTNSPCALAVAASPAHLRPRALLSRSSVAPEGGGLVKDGVHVADHRRDQVDHLRYAREPGKVWGGGAPSKRL